METQTRMQPPAGHGSPGGVKGEVGRGIGDHLEGMLQARWITAHMYYMYYVCITCITAHMYYMYYVCITCIILYKLCVCVE